MELNQHQKEAIRHAIRIMKEEHRRLATDANSADQYGAEYPAAKNAIIERRKISMRMEVLQAMLASDVRSHATVRRR